MGRSCDHELGLRSSTGDVGVIDERGLLHLHDRSKDVIISGGTKASGDMRAYLRQHFLLTRLLGEASRNVYAAEFYSVLQTNSRRFLYFHRDRYSDLKTICDLHIRQIEAVIAGDVELAKRTSTARSDYAETFTREVVMELIVNSSVTIVESAVSPPERLKG